MSRGSLRKLGGVAVEQSRLSEIGARSMFASSTRDKSSTSAPPSLLCSTTAFSRVQLPSNSRGLLQRDDSEPERFIPMQAQSMSWSTGRNLESNFLC